MSATEHAVSEVRASSLCRASGCSTSSRTRRSTRASTAPARVKASRPGGPSGSAMGVRFGMSMRMGLPYRTSNRRRRVRGGQRIAWAHFSRAVWRWEFRDVEGGTEVTETFDWSNARSRTFMRRFAPGNRVAMRRSLERLELLARAPLRRDPLRRPVACQGRRGLRCRAPRQSAAGLRGVTSSGSSGAPRVVGSR
jgi:hypothetical protein